MTSKLGPAVKTSSSMLSYNSLERSLSRCWNVAVGDMLAVLMLVEENMAVMF